MRCWKRHDIPSRFHYGGNPRVPPIVCLAQAGWLITTHQAQARYRHPMRGEHGYDNLDPLMRALFVAEGPSFRRGVTTPPFPNVDVYPLLAHILDIAPERNDGNYTQVEQMLQPAER
jgi:predicted AlkP superfamily pyrophosphatase or phosphodiesterase